MTISSICRIRSLRIIRKCHFGIGQHNLLLLQPLTGHDAAIKETARLTDERLELSEEVIAQLNEKINIIRNNIGIEQNVSITYFIPDAKKAGGSYVMCSGIVKKVDEYEHTIIMTDQTVIPIEQIIDIKCEEW